jgi:hypothetical protein
VDIEAIRADMENHALVPAISTGPKLEADMQRSREERLNARVHRHGLRRGVPASGRDDSPGQGP